MRFTSQQTKLACPFHDPEDELAPQLEVGVDLTEDGLVLRVMSAEGCRHVEEDYDELTSAEFHQLCEAIEEALDARRARAVSRGTAA